MWALRCLVAVLATLWLLSHDSMAAESKPELKGSLVRLTTILGELLSDPTSPAARKVLQADLSSSCTIGLLNIVKALKRNEAWIMRFIDASAKYPNGLFEGTQADLGAFDECVETVIFDKYGREKIRGQYCNLDVNIVGDNSIQEHLRPAALISSKRAPLGLYNVEEDFGVRLGICMITDCSQTDLQNLADALTDDGPVRVNITHCVTNQEPPLDQVQIGVTAFLGAIAAIVFASTAYDVGLIVLRRKGFKTSGLQKFLTAFSIATNTKLLLKLPVHGEPFSHRFLHGLRFFSIIGVMLCHAYLPIAPLNTRLVNALNYGDQWQFCLVTGAHLSIDVLFFISGYLLANKVLKHERNPVGTLALFIGCRFVRTTVPLFFVVMCFYLVPAMIWGPNSAELYEKFYHDMEKHWWLLLIQARNAMSGPGSSVLRHLWYISADFQLFIVALPILLLFKSKPRPAIFAFLALSLLGSSLTAWQMYDSGFDPFVFVTSKTFTAKTDMFSNVYVLPSFHGPCFFAGCICYYLVNKKRSINLSKVLQLTLWTVSLACFLACIFVRFDWDRGTNSNEDWVKMLVAFLERPVWSIFLMWLVFACATGNGGIINEFLSWEALVPMGRLTFGVYLTYFPVHYLVYYVSRERMAFNHFRLVTNCLGVAVWSYCLSYLLYLFCCAPVRNLEKAFCGEDEIDETETDYESDFNRSGHIKPLKSHGNIYTDTTSRDENSAKKEKSTRL